MGQHRKRIPKLSEKPEPGRGLYYASYCTAQGKSRRKRFTANRQESARLYRLWLIDHLNYVSAADQPGVDQPLADAILTSWGAIAMDLVRMEKTRVRSDDGPRRPGTITIREFQDAESIHKTLLSWAQQKWSGAIVNHTPFAELMTLNAFEEMMVWLANVKQYGISRIRKHRRRFWELARFARSAPYNQRLSFDQEDTRKMRFASAPSGKKWLPTVADLKKLLKAATPVERLWIWMAIGLGFGNQDISQSCPHHFDQESYDLRRGKTERERYGRMLPQVWVHLQAYLKDCPRQPDELLFTTKNGRPLRYRRIKTEDELKNGTRTHGPNNRTLYVELNRILQRWYKLLERAGLKGKWHGGFYRLRSLGATVFAHRPGVSLLGVRTFLGHGRSDVAELYMQALRPEIKPTIEWLTRVLDSPALNAAFEVGRAIPTPAEPAQV